MNRFTDAVLLSLETKNWYAALALSLALPDICSSLETPDVAVRRKVGRRYAAWCNKWLTPKYTSYHPGHIHHHVFLSGEDCYALRCSLLHQGSDDLKDQDARKVLERFQFTSPGDNFIHMNQFGAHLQLQVDVFCMDIVSAVNSWVEFVVNDESINKEMRSLITIS